MDVSFGQMEAVKNTFIIVPNFCGRKPSQHRGKGLLAAQ
jgi:hypothetical protein